MLEPFPTRIIGFNHVPYSSNYGYVIRQIMALPEGSTVAIEIPESFVQRRKKNLKNIPVSNRLKVFEELLGESLNKKYSENERNAYLAHVLTSISLLFGHDVIGLEPKRGKRLRAQYRETFNRLIEEACLEEKKIKTLGAFRRLLTRVKNVFLFATGLKKNLMYECQKYDRKVREQDTLRSLAFFQTILDKRPTLALMGRLHGEEILAAGYPVDLPEEKNQELLKRINLSRDTDAVLVKFMPTHDSLPAFKQKVIDKMRSKFQKWKAQPAQT